MKHAGSCRCGAFRYTLETAGMPVAYACHCLECQTMSGSACTLQSLVPMANLTLEGETIDWSHANSRGAVTVQRFCATCKTRVYSTNESRPGMAILRAGTLDDSAGLVPAAHMWVKRKQPWIGLPPKAETHAESVPPERMMALFAPNFAPCS